MLSEAFGGVLMINGGYFAIKSGSFGNVSSIIFAKYATTESSSKAGGVFLHLLHNRHQSLTLTPLQTRCLSCVRILSLED